MSTVKALKAQYYAAIKKRQVPDGLVAYAACHTDTHPLCYISEGGVWRLYSFHDGTAMRLEYPGDVLEPWCFAENGNKIQRIEIARWLADPTYKIQSR